MERKEEGEGEGGGRECSSQLKSHEASVACSLHGKGERLDKTGKCTYSTSQQKGIKMGHYLYCYVTTD